jgi:peroxiredoxin
MSNIMKIGTATGIALLGMMAFTQSSNALNIGDPMVDADVKMKNIDGKEFSINDVQGEKGALIIFSSTHCPFVLGWQNTMVELGNTYQNKGVGVLFINSNDPATAGDTYESMQEMAKAKGYEFPFVVDATSDVARNFGAAKTPDVFLFDASGKLAYKGAIGEGGRKPKDGGETYLQNALDALLAGTTVEKTATKAVGCSIKFR